MGLWRASSGFSFFYMFFLYYHKNIENTKILDMMGIIASFYIIFYIPFYIKVYIKAYINIYIYYYINR